MMQCVQNGHEIVALANLKPRDGGMSEWEPLLCTYCINVKPDLAVGRGWGGGGGWGARATHGNLTVTFIPRVGILISSSFNYK